MEHLFDKVRPPSVVTIMRDIRRMENLKGRTRKHEVATVAEAAILLGAALLQHLAEPCLENARNIAEGQQRLNACYRASARQVSLPPGVYPGDDLFPKALQKRNVKQAFKGLYRMGTWLKWQYGISA